MQENTTTTTISKKIQYQSLIEVNASKLIARQQACDKINKYQSLIEVNARIVCRAAHVPQSLCINPL